MASDFQSKYNTKTPIASFNDLLGYIDQIIDLGCNGFIDKILKSKKEEIPHEDIYNKNLSNYNVFLFNCWKKSILNIEYDDIKKGTYDVDFDIMPIKNYLSRIPDAQSNDDVEKYLKPLDFELKLFISKYIFCEKQGFWKTVNSDKLKMTKSNLENDGVIVLNIKRYDMPKFCKIFTRLCLERNIPFSYKYNDSGNINNNFVLSFDNEYLDKYMELIREIFAKFPNLASRIGKPSPLVEYTTDNIGIVGGDYDDYMLNRSEQVCEWINDLSDFIMKLSTNFIQSNMKKKIVTESGSLSIADFISLEIAKEIQSEKCCDSVNKGTYSDFIKYESPVYLKKLAISIRKAIIKKSETLMSNDGFTISFDNSCIPINKGIINNALIKVTKYIYKSYPHMRESLKSYIKISTSKINTDEIRSFQMKKKRVFYDVNPK